MTQPDVLRTPAEWSALDGVTVMDPDGWRGSKTLPAKSWDEPIDRDEWEQRLSVSTQSAIRTVPDLAKPGTAVHVDWAGELVVLTFDLADGSTFRTQLTAEASQRLRGDMERAEASARRYRRSDFGVPIAEQVLIAETEQSLPHDWRAAYIPPSTPFWDEPGETQPPGWFVFGGFSDDREEGAAFVLGVEQALDRDDTGMSLERLAKAVAARLNGDQA